MKTSVGLMSGEVGIYDIEPYVEEINRKQVLVCMCDKCFHMSAMDI